MRHLIRLVLFLGILGLVAGTMPAHELSVLPANKTSSSVVGNWATASGSVYFMFSVPDDLESFRSAKVVLLGLNDKEIVYDLKLSVAEAGNPADAIEVELLDSRATVVKSQLHELDVSWVFEGVELLAGQDVVSLYVRADPMSCARVLLLRFQYDGPAGPTGVTGPQGPTGAVGPPGPTGSATDVGFATYVDETETASCNPANSPSYYRTCSRSCSCTVSGLGSYNYYADNCSVCGSYQCNPYACEEGTCWETCCHSCYRWDAETKSCSCNPPNCDPGSTPFSASCTASSTNTCPEGEGFIIALTGSVTSGYTGSIASCSASSSCNADNPTCATAACSCSATGNYDEDKSCSCSSSCGNSATCATGPAECNPLNRIVCGRIVEAD